MKQRASFRTPAGRGEKNLLFPLLFVAGRIHDAQQKGTVAIVVIGPRYERRPETFGDFLHRIEQPRAETVVFVDLDFVHKRRIGFSLGGGDRSKRIPRQLQTNG